MTLTHFIEMPHFEPRLFKIDTNKLPTCQSGLKKLHIYINLLVTYNSEYQFHSSLGL